MCYYVVNFSDKVITKCETHNQARTLCATTLTKSRSLNVFFFNKIDFNKLDLDIAEFTELTNF